MKVREIRSKTEAEIKETLEKTKKALKEARIAYMERKNKDVKKPLLLRKDIAKLLTVLNEKKIISEVK